MKLFDGGLSVVNELYNTCFYNYFNVEIEVT